MARSPGILFVHLFNNYSGSPIVLRQVIIACQETGVNCRLLIGNRGGILDDLSVENHCCNYRYCDNKFLKLGYYLLTQLRMFLKVLFLTSSNDIVYINTMLPFGAALAARMRGCNVIYHIHEINISPQLFKKFLRLVIELTADRVLYVSQTLSNEEEFKKPEQFVVYNALSVGFEKRALRIQPDNSRKVFNVLMISSPKAYKGVFEFVKLAVSCCDEVDLHFTLVLGAEADHVVEFLSDIVIPRNLTVHSWKNDVLPIYQKSHVLLNLTRPQQCIETFGLTVLEAMSCGIPVIVPKVGGPTELVCDGVEGFLIDGHNTEKIKATILRLKDDIILYKRLSLAAKERSMVFSNRKFTRNILEQILKIFVIIFYGSIKYSA